MKYLIIISILLSSCISTGKTPCDIVCKAAFPQYQNVSAEPQDDPNIDEWYLSKDRTSCNCIIKDIKIIK